DLVRGRVARGEGFGQNAAGGVGDVGDDVVVAAIAIVDDEALVASDDEVVTVLLRALEKTIGDKVEVITVYYGADTRPSQAEEVVRQVREKYPGVQVELVQGGQPHYNYIVSLEG
ncbi:MAG: hypothetical protein N3E40_07985, partial [Dehalococcoidia bacterium]|nr:hypothetical protein [Dehalococcoidia bacterium]